ncbi:cohesin domain-containing protein [Orenia marismortui]|uniref:Cohesin domain-containing protein n=1 Tax=Orenia marismortui TaxID=46469 RepID=A0A4R8H1A2_9FIRM|nr:cohesin domain-containing protein [Orenia marismortui]TDX53297.1 cohesin domain-containing protein [Orenia marismortui]
MKNKVSLILLFLVIFSSSAFASIDQYGNLQLKNNYISVIVNQNEFNKGRFAIDVTGGAPMRSGDDGKPLVYGHPYPWSSYTTIKIDGKNYVFGGKTDKRAGKNGNYGELLQAPTIKNNSIITKYKFDKIIVSQILNLVKSSTTGLPDTVQITYRVSNKDNKDHQVGTRVMIDTMLGENDGAPFRVKNQAITGDNLFSKDEIPSFWQAFDELTDPKVTAQGTIKGPGLTTPEEVYFADWGSLADGLWEFEFNSAEEFLRKGEFELDSATALFWQAKRLKPGETRTYVTNYGLGGITMVPGLLSLGVTSPAEVVMDNPNKTLDIVAYIQNTAEITVKDVKVQLDLPNNLELIRDYQIKKIGNLEPGETSQVMWEVRPLDLSEQELEYSVKATAENTDDNQVSRGLKLVGPPKLSLELRAPNKIGVKNDSLAQDNFNLEAEISNQGASTAYGIDTYLALSPGLTLSKGDKYNKFLGFLEPGESIIVPWKIKPISLVDGELAYSLEINSTNAPIEVESKKIYIPKLDPKATIEILAKKGGYMVGDYITAQIKLKNLADFYSLKSNIRYNKDVLEAIYVSRGSLFVEKGKYLKWNMPVIDSKEGIIKNIAASLNQEQSINNEVVANIHFKIKSLGSFDLHFVDFKAYNENEEKIKLELTDNLLNIRRN